MERVTTKLRKLLAGPGCLVAPGVADGLAARLVKLAGFDACELPVVAHADFSFTARPRIHAAR